MITPENYYLEYKKISTLVNEKYVYIIAFIIAIPILLLVYNMQTYIVLIMPLILYLFIVYKCLKKFSFWVKKNKIKKLKQLTKDENINKDNFENKYYDYIINNLKIILKKNNINKNIYNSFYRNNLSIYQNMSKNILGDNVYISFIFGSIYVSTIQAMYNLPKSVDEILITLAFIITISLFIIYVIHEIKQTTQSKYNNISKLIFYTERIFLDED